MTAERTERTETEFILPQAEFEPAYMTLYRSGELQRRACFRADTSRHKPRR